MCARPGGHDRRIVGTKNERQFGLGGDGSYYRCECGRVVPGGTDRDRVQHGARARYSTGEIGDGLDPCGAVIFGQVIGKSIAIGVGLW